MMARFPKPIPNPAGSSSGFTDENDERTDPDIRRPAPAVAASDNPLEALLRDPTLSEIMVNDLRNIFVERDGLLMETSVRFSTPESLQRAIQKLLDGSGRILTREQPYADFRGQDGSRIHIVLPPLADQGPSITIRRFPRALGMSELIREKLLPESMAELIQRIVAKKKNVLISGGTSTGKTTLLNALLELIPRNERLVVIEETPELRIKHPNSVKLVTQLPSPTSSGVDARDLIANSLRMRPDRLLMGELRRSEAFDFLLAMNTGHEGSMATLHANSPRDALARLESLCLMAGASLPLAALRKQISRAVDFVIQLERFRTGTRRITHISQVTGMEGDVITMQELWAPQGDSDVSSTTSIPALGLD